MKQPNTLSGIESSQLKGRIERVYFSGATYSAGLLRQECGASARFKASFCANVGDSVTLSGSWRKDPKYGYQFVADSVSYELPETQDGLIEYLSEHPAFKGIGPATAKKLVEYAGDSQTLESIITGDVTAIASVLKIQFDVLNNLRTQWLANASENKVRIYLAEFGLTVRQVDTLLERFGESVIGLLNSDPYQLIHYVDGYGFKRADSIAQKLGIKKDHPGRIDAGLVYCVQQSIDDGHTYIKGADLIDAANLLLTLDTLDSKQRIEARGNHLLTTGAIVSDGPSVSLPYIYQAEKRIRTVFERYAWTRRPILQGSEASCPLTDAQLDAFRMALQYAISVISGGAGTGKTYVISRLARAFTDAGFHVALCAPTGKAAKRIEELLSQYGLELKAYTIHRLLRYDGRAFQRESLSEEEKTGDSTLPRYDVVIMDEFSMTDVPLFSELIDRIDFDKTRLILVGDHNQLPPVGPGNILRDILKHQLTPTTILSKCHRQAGVLKTNACGVLDGRLAPSAGPANGWMVIDSFREPEAIDVYLRDLVRFRLPDFYGYDPIRDVQIITPTHKGLLGTKALNEKLQYLFHGSVDGKFAVGDKVIQTRNDYKLDIMNGTQGIVADQLEKSYIIDFDGVGRKIIDRENASHLQLAYALTAHRCQGSEFPCAVVICHKSHFFADRNWLYTAVTRAAKTCILLGDGWGIRNALRKNHAICRRTFLSQWAADSASIDHPQLPMTPPSQSTVTSCSSSHTDNE